MWQWIKTVAARPLSARTKAAFYLGGAVLPVVCFLMAIGMGFKGEWQSGNLNDYLGYLLSPPAVLPFYLLLIYAIASLVAVLSREGASRYFVARLGSTRGFP